jgi:CHAT domain-containing protein
MPTLVTLSACSTATGRAQGAEGVMTLARTFLMSGVRTVMATLWEADDRATASLMTRFYGHIAKGTPIAESLRNAQIDVLNDFGRDSPPAFWASFSVIGDGTKSINVDSPTSYETRARRSLR